MNPDPPKDVGLEPHMNALTMPHSVKMAGTKMQHTRTRIVAAAPGGGGAEGGASPYRLPFLLFAVRLALQEAIPQMGHTSVLTMSAVSIYWDDDF